MPISDVRLTLSAQIIQVDPVAAGARLVGQTASDALSQAARVVTFPIAKALVLNVSQALGVGGVVRAETAFDTSPTSAIGGTTPAAMERQGGGLVGTIQNIVVDGVTTTVRLVPAIVNAGLGVAVSTVNAIVQTGVASARAVLDVGDAVLTLNPGAVLNAAAIGVVRVAGTVEQTTIGVPAQTVYSAQPDRMISAPTVRTRIPSIVTSILNGRQEIADAISPSDVKQKALTAGASRTASTTNAATEQRDTTTSVAKTTTKSSSTKSSTAKSTGKESRTAKSTTGPKHAKK